MCQVCTGYGKCHIHASWSGECNKYYNSPQSSVSVQSSFVTFISWPKGLHSHCLICLSFFPSNLHAAKVACVQHFPLFISSFYLSSNTSGLFEWCLCGCVKAQPEHNIFSPLLPNRHHHQSEVTSLTPPRGETQRDINRAASKFST